MILIITDENDQSTLEVINWLKHYNQKLIRVNDTSKISINYITLKNNVTQFELKVTSELVSCPVIIDSEEITGVWYRRGHFSFSSVENIKDSSIRRYLINEEEKLRDFIDNIFALNFKHLNRYEDNKINKLVTLVYASTVGLAVPFTFISSDVKNIRDITLED